MRKVFVALCVLTTTVFLSACGGESREAVVEQPEPVDLASLGVDPTTQQRCDPIGTRCLLPLPNDHFTVADHSTPTGRRVALSPESVPVNEKGKAIDVTDQNRADGWSPGSALIVQLPGLDIQKSQLPGLVNPQRSLDADSPIVLFDATTGQRHPFWAEIDSLADEADLPVLFVRPARNFPDGHRIVVGFRNLVDSSSNKLSATPAFAAYRDSVITTDETFEQRRAEMERIFADLGRTGVRRADLQLAWDFTVASTHCLTGRMISMRDEAFAELGDAAPRFTVDSVLENPNGEVRRRISGSFELPLFLTLDGRPHGRLKLDANGKPLRQPGVFTAGYICNLPPASETSPARMSLYGHGLLGSRGEVNGSLTRRMGADYNIAYCATDWYGMAEDDVNTAISALADLSRFPQIADRLQQGYLAFLFLGRLMKHPEGFSAHEAFRFHGQSALKIDELYYDGNSQGAIQGLSLIAIAQDFTRAVLAEAGMNYSTLLDRSVDFDEYLDVVAKPSYPKRLDRVIGFSLAQMLWDRGEGNGYANHATTDPLPNTPEHQVLLLGAVGDHQVSEYSLRVEAATVGAAAHIPVSLPGRVAESDPAWLLTPLKDFPHTGSAYYLWDTGSPASPVGNVPPREGHDPHDDTPNIPEVRALKDQFWHPAGRIDGTICNDQPCTAPVPPENAD